jgi:hypothetical protein
MTKIEEQLRDAARDLDHAFAATVPPPFRNLPPVRGDRPRDRRRVLAIALAASVCIALVAAFVVRSRDNTDTIDIIGPPTSLPSDGLTTVPNYVGFRLGAQIDSLRSRGFDVEVVGIDGPNYPPGGRIVSVEPAPGTPIAPGSKLTFVVGDAMAILDGEVDTGFAGIHTELGAWRLVVSTQFPLAPNGGYTFILLADKGQWNPATSVLASSRIAQYTQRQYEGVAILNGTAPRNAVAVEAIDANGTIIGRVSTKHFDGDFEEVTLWMLEVDAPRGSTLRALDRDGNVIDQQGIVSVNVATPAATVRGSVVVDGETWLLIEEGSCLKVRDPSGFYTLTGCGGLGDFGHVSGGGSYNGVAYFKAAGRVPSNVTRVELVAKTGESLTVTAGDRAYFVVTADPAFAITSEGSRVAMTRYFTSEGLLCVMTDPAEAPTPDVPQCPK